jgi:hypothetical protein
MIVDCTTFFDGLDILEIRLNCLAPYVDRFIICESPYNMLGVKKPLIFEENKDLFKDFPITHLIVHDHQRHMNGVWKPYYYQLDYMLRAMENVPDEAIVMLSDFDEIPNLKEYKMEEGIFLQQLYYYYLNVKVNSMWNGTIAVSKKHLTSFAGMRKNRGRIPQVKCFGGWHFSYVSSAEDIVKKIESFCHREFNTEEIKGKVAERRAKLIDPFGRFDEVPFVVEMPTGPEWLLENRSRYEHLFYKEIDNAS